MSHQWNGSGPLRRGDDPSDWVQPGETFEPTDAEASAFADLIQLGDEEVDAEEVGPAVEGRDPQQIVEPPFDPSDHTVSEVEDRLDEGDFDEAELDALYSAEREADDRVGATDAIEDRIAELNE